MYVELFIFFVVFLVVLLAYIFYKKKFLPKKQPTLSSDKKYNSADSPQDSDELYFFYHIFTVAEMNEISKSIRRLEKNLIFQLLKNLSDSLSKVKETKYQIMYWKEEGYGVSTLDEDFIAIEDLRLQIIHHIHENNLDKIREIISQIDKKREIILQKAENIVLEDTQYYEKLKNWDDEKKQLNKLLHSSQAVWDKIKDFSVFSMDYDFENVVFEYREAEKTIDRICRDVIANEKKITIEDKEELALAYQKIQNTNIKFQEILKKLDEIQQTNDLLRISLSDLFSQMNEAKKIYKYQNEDFLLRIENVERYYLEAKKCLEMKDLGIVKEFIEKIQNNLKQAVEIGESLNSKIIENRKKLEMSKRKTIEEWEMKKLLIRTFPHEKQEKLSNAIKEIEKSIEMACEAEAKVDLSTFQAADTSLKIAIGKYEKTFQAIKNLIKE